MGPPEVINMDEIMAIIAENRRGFAGFYYPEESQKSVCRKWHGKRFPTLREDDQRFSDELYEECKKLEKGFCGPRDLRLK